VNIWHTCYSSCFPFAGSEGEAEATLRFLLASASAVMDCEVATNAADALRRSLAAGSGGSGRAKIHLGLDMIKGED